MQSFNLNPELIMKDIYSYPFPEVRELLRSQDLPPEFMLNTLPATAAAELIDTYQFSPPLTLPAHEGGALELDQLHEPVIERIRAVQGRHLLGLEGFDNAYPMPGSSESMFHILAEWKARGEVSSVAVLEGEYEGYSAYAESLGIPVTRYESFDDATQKEGELWFVTNPSARDGNWIAKDSWDSFVSAGHQIVYDAAYVGLTEEGTVDVSAPNIRAVLTSPSKLFGVFRYRNTGITYAREPLQSLYGSKWFKDVPALLASLSLYENFGDNELPKRYRQTQAALCHSLTELVGKEVLPSDVLLLGHTTEEAGSQYAQFERVKGCVRFGLTKLFEDYEKQMK